MAQIAELSREIQAAVSMRAASNVEGESARATTVESEVVDAASAAKEALSVLEASTEKLKNDRQQDEEKRAHVAAANAALASAKGKIAAHEFVGARAARMVAEQFFKKAGPDVWKEKRQLVARLDADILLEEEAANKESEVQVNLQAGESAIKVVREKLAQNDVVSL